MTKKAGTVDPYPRDPEGLRQMYLDGDYQAAKYRALQDRSTVIQELEESGDGWRLTVEREVDANLPDFAKKVLGDTNRLIQREVWHKSGEDYVCDVVIDSPGKPVAIKGTMRMERTGPDTSNWHVDFAIKASVPLVGGKIEQLVADEAQDNLAKEYAFNQQWLASH
jgi:hypothetical protein